MPEQTEHGQPSAPVLNAGAPEVVVDLPSGTGEGPLWHEDAQKLYWVDISAGTLFRYDPESGVNELVYRHDAQIGGYTIQRDGSLVLFCSEGKILRLIGDQTEVIVPGIDKERTGRFNDVIADPEGRVFCGTMPTEDGLARLYRLDPDGTLTEIYDDIALSNGCGFSPDLSTFYLTDSNNRRIYRARYDRSSGELSDREVLIETPDDGSVPDGMTVDAEGNIWSARWDGRALFKYSPEGDLLGHVPFPVRKVSSVAFAGDAYDVAYVTTAGGPSRSADEGMVAGSLFRVDLKTTGRAPFRSRLGL
jgi:D-xylono/L-arabinono-1,4-lactonase